MDESKRTEGMKAQAPPTSQHSGGASGTRIQTYSGLFVDPLNMTPGEIRLQDIAHALGNIGRFTGHASRFLSVAEHSINVAMVAGAEAPLELAVTFRLAGLLHDASEAYLNDVARPLKYRPEFAFYREAEDKLMDMIYMKYLGTLDPAILNIVHQADNIMLGIEARDLMWRGAPPDSSAGLNRKEQAKYEKWLAHWPEIKLIPDELYYRVSVAQAPSHKRSGERRAVLGDREMGGNGEHSGGGYAAGQEWLEMVRRFAPSGVVWE